MNNMSNSLALLTKLTKQLEEELRSQQDLMLFLENMGVYVGKCSFCGDWNNLEWEDIYRRDCRTCNDEHIYCDYTCYNAGFCPE